MSLNIILIATSVVILGLTVLLFIYINRFIKWITTKLEKLHPNYVEPDTPHRRNNKESVLTFLNIVLVVFIGIFYLSGDLGDTILNRDFVVDEVRDSDIVMLGSELLDKQSTDVLVEKVKQWLGQSFVNLGPSDNLVSGVSDLSGDKLYIAEAITSTLTELNDTLKKETLAVLNSIYDYFTEETSSINIEFPLSHVQEALRQNLQVAITKSPTLELQGATAEQVQSYADMLYQENFSHIPNQLNFSEATSPSYIIVALNQVRQFITHLPTISTLLLIGIVILMALIILIQRNIKQSMWTLGTTLLITGIVDFLYLTIAKMILSRADLLSFLPAINMWLIDLISDVLVAISQPFTLMMIVGGVMLILSILWSFIHFGQSKLNTAQ